MAVTVGIRAGWGVAVGSAVGEGGAGGVGGVWVIGGCDVVAVGMDVGPGVAVGSGVAERMGVQWVVGVAGMGVDGAVAGSVEVGDASGVVVGRGRSVGAMVGRGMVPMVWPSSVALAVAAAAIAQRAIPLMKRMATKARATMRMRAFWSVPICWRKVWN